MRLAVLDIGTNTVLLLIVGIENGKISVLRDRHAIARLGEGVDRTHIISEEAYTRFIAIMRTHNDVIRSFNVDQIVAVGTSALRDAQNRDEIIQRAHQDTGIQIEMLSGEDEARWSYMGALFGMQNVVNTAVLDIGGGSTEIAFGDGKEFSHGVSLDIGAVRLTERYFENIPASKESESKARKLIQLELAKAVSYHSKIERLIAVAGTPTTLAAMAQNLQQFEADKVQNFVLSLNTINALLELLLRTPTAEVLAHYPAVNKARADILPAGTLILHEAMVFLGVQEVRVSAHGLRYGIALREAQV